MAVPPVNWELREAKKRDEILDKALGIFAPNGYLGTTTDMLAKEAAISKQTLYKLFGDKDGVFAALVQRHTDQAIDPFVPLVERISTIDSAEEAVQLLADQFVRAIMNPGIQNLRRLVIAESVRFPELGEEYWNAGFGQLLTTLAECLDLLTQRGLLDVPDTRLAAQFFAGLFIWIPGNRAMFEPRRPPMDEDEISNIINQGSQMFVRAYGTDQN